MNLVNRTGYYVSSIKKRDVEQMGRKKRKKETSEIIILTKQQCKKTGSSVRVSCIGI